MPSSTRFPRASPVFVTTQWSLVLKAAGQDPVTAQRALSTLCENYWYPVYAFLRRAGIDEHMAKDHTQDFFARLLRNDGFARLDPSKGRFRSYLLASLKNFLATQWERQQAKKRGGECTLVSWDQELAENRYVTEPLDVSTPETIFDRRWALTLIEKATQRLRGEYDHAGRLALFEALHDSLSGGESLAYPELAAQLEKSEGAVRVSVHRLRQRFGELLREEIGQTVVDPSEIDSELHHLLGALRG